MNVFFFDTETTGLIQNIALPTEKQPRVIEIYGCIVSFDEYGEHEIKSDVESLFDPGVKISKEVEKITGISDLDVKGKPAFGSFIEPISFLMDQCEAICAHNLHYDLHLMTTEFKRYGTDISLPRRKICTVEATEYLKGHRLSLSALHIDLFGEGFPSAHRAKNDVLPLINCYRRLREIGVVQ